MSRSYLQGGNLEAMINSYKGDDPCFIYWVDGGLITIVCDHTFHKECLNEWLNTSGKRSCPSCRSEGQFFGRRKRSQKNKSSKVYTKTYKIKNGNKWYKLFNEDSRLTIIDPKIKPDKWCTNCNIVARPNNNNISTRSNDCSTNITKCSKIPCNSKIFCT